MRKTIQIDDRSVELNSSAGWLYVYRNQVGRDILPDIMPMIESFLSLAIDAMKRTGGVLSDMDDLLLLADEDLMDDIYARLAGLESITLLNIFWALAKNADRSIPGPEEYFSGFDVLPLDEVLPEVFRMIIESSLSSKNSQSLLKRMKIQMNQTENQSI